MSSAVSVAIEVMIGAAAITNGNSGARARLWREEHPRNHGWIMLQSAAKGQRAGLDTPATPEPDRDHHLALVPLIALVHSVIRCDVPVHSQR